MTEPQEQSEGHGRYLGLAALAVVVIVVAVLLVWLPNRNAAPFTPPQANAKLVGLQVLTPVDALGSNIKSALDRLGGSTHNGIELPNGHRRWQYVIGRVNVVGHVAPNAEYNVIVVDSGTHRVTPSTYCYPEPGQAARDQQGWEPALSSLANRYDWQPSNEDQAAFFPADRITSFIFWAQLPSDTNPVADPHADISVVLVLTSGSDHVYWSEKIN